LNVHRFYIISEYYYNLFILQTDHLDLHSRFVAYAAYGGTLFVAKKYPWNAASVKALLAAPPRLQNVSWRFWSEPPAPRADALEKLTQQGHAAL
jgi:hypothetical protein